MSVFLTRDAAEDYAYGGSVAKQEVSQHRWYTKYLIVFEDESGFRGFYYDEPATELQEGGEEFEAVPVPTYPVVGRETTVVVWEVPDAG